MNINIAILEHLESDYKVLANQLNQWQIKNSHILNITWFQDEEDIIDSIKTNDFDILFSDIKINKESKITGIDICSSLRDQGFTGEIIFLTAFSEYVFAAYSVHAFNYLLKPIDEVSLNNCMEKYLALHSNDYYYFQKGNSIIKISFKDIICINKDIHDAIIQTKDNLYIERISLSKIEKKLPGQFVRCHKSSIINLRHVESIVGNNIHLSNGLTQVVGRSYLPTIRKAIIKTANKYK